MRRKAKIQGDFARCIWSLFACSDWPRGKAPSLGEFTMQCDPPWTWRIVASTMAIEWAMQARHGPLMDAPDEGTYTLVTLIARWLIGTPPEFSMPDPFNFAPIISFRVCIGASLDPVGFQQSTFQNSVTLTAFEPRLSLLVRPPFHHSMPLLLSISLIIRPQSCCHFASQTMRFSFYQNWHRSDYLKELDRASTAD